MNLDTTRRPRTLLELTGISAPFSPFTGVGTKETPPSGYPAPCQCVTTPCNCTTDLGMFPWIEMDLFDFGNVGLGNTGGESSAVETVDGGGDAGTVNSANPESTLNASVLITAAIGYFLLK